MNQDQSIFDGFPMWLEDIPHTSFRLSQTHHYFIGEALRDLAVNAIAWIVTNTRAVIARVR